MKFAAIDHQGDRCYGIVEGDRIMLISGDPLDGRVEPTGETIPSAGARLLAPVRPTKVICVGLNYYDHAAEVGMTPPEEPILFFKPPTSIIGPAETIRLPEQSQRIDYEAELAIVIGRECRSVAREEAAVCIFGYTCANDVTARDLQVKDMQWTRAKSFDTFLPLGPYLVTGIDPDDLRISARLNGQVRQSSSTAQMIFGVDELVEFISSIMTLLPGDIILTGTPPGIGPMNPGDVIEIEVEGIGILRNYFEK